MQENTFLKGNILPPLIKFALPLMLSQLLQALYGAVDLIVVGHLVLLPIFLQYQRQASLCRE